MANVVDIDQGHSKPVTDTKQRLLHPAREDPAAEEASRYPIATKITEANVPSLNLYTCKELNAMGVIIQPEKVHTDVPNLTGAVLLVGDVVALFHNPEDAGSGSPDGFFFGDIP